MGIPELIDQYAAGPQTLRDAIAGMTLDQIDAAPVPGKWSTRQVICHLADFETVTNHIPHHAQFIAEKRQALKSA